MPCETPHTACTWGLRMSDRTSEVAEFERSRQFGPITPREREVAELIVEGLSNEQIAQRLVLTPGTVANHVAHILSKLGLQSRVQIAVRIAGQKSSSQSQTVLALLERLQQMDAADLSGALQHATDVLAVTFAAEKVDAFLYDAALDRLVTLGTSATPLGRRQHALGLHHLPVSQGGRVAWVFQEARSFRDGHVDKDAVELVGIRRDLGIRSTLAAPFEVNAEQRGVLLVSSTQPDHFTEAQLQLLQFVAYWVGLVAREQSSSDEDRDGVGH